MAGDVLVQPAGTVEQSVAGPFEPDCFTTVNAYTPSQNLDRPMQCLEAEAWGDLQRTNQADTAASTFRMDRCADLMDAHPDAFPWPTSDQQAASRVSLAVRISFRVMHTK
jgi:hypothetical protein